ncbi:MAG: cytochrome c biogenesis protein ResB [Rubrivivax sp.]|nr:cytochrome c biogenesis protein ResB [Rubrivivax sp.]
MRPAWPSIVAHVGSLKSTLALFALLAAVVFARPDFIALAIVMVALALNLAAAIARHPALRRRFALLVAHLALLALVAGAGLGRMLALDGRFELTEGVPFDGRLIDGERGALHRERLSHLRFTQHGFEIDYAPGRKRGATRNAVSWVDAEGRERRAVIGDHVPLVLDGHRFYTSPNKGFAPVLRWQPDGGEAVRGAVHLPSYPMHELRQSRPWTLPDGREAWVLLAFDEALIPPEAAARFRLPEVHRLVLRVGDERHELAPGVSATVAGGVLTYEGLATWMGYRVAYDPTLPWLLAASLLAALSLAWHYAATFCAAAASRPVAAAASRPAAAAAPAPAPAAVAATAPAAKAATRWEWADG